MKINKKSLLLILIILLFLISEIYLIIQGNFNTLYYKLFNIKIPTPDVVEEVYFLPGKEDNIHIWMQLMDTEKVQNLLETKFEHGLTLNDIITNKNNYYLYLNTVYYTTNVDALIILNVDDNIVYELFSF